MLRNSNNFVLHNLVGNAVPTGDVEDVGVGEGDVEGAEYIAVVAVVVQQPQNDLVEVPLLQLGHNLALDMPLVADRMLELQ